MEFFSCLLYTVCPPKADRPVCLGQAYGNCLLPLHSYLMMEYIGSHGGRTSGLVWRIATTSLGRYLR